MIYNSLVNCTYVKWLLFLPMKLQCSVCIVINEQLICTFKLTEVHTNI